MTNYSYLLNNNILPNRLHSIQLPSYIHQLHQYLKLIHNGGSHFSNDHPLEIKNILVLVYYYVMILIILVISILRHFWLTYKSSKTLFGYFNTKCAWRMRFITGAFYRDMAILVEFFICTTIIRSFWIATCRTLIALDSTHYTGQIKL